MFIKHDINNFYIGDIYFSNEYQKKNDDVFSKRTSYLRKNGAIELGYSYTYFKDIDQYYSSRYLSVFLKDKDRCISLLDGNEYTPNGFLFYANLKPLSDLLPKWDYDVPSEITSRKAINYFFLLLKNNTKNKQLLYILLNKSIFSTDLYYSRPHNMEDFLVGDLKMYRGNGYEYQSISEIKYDNKVCELLIEKNGIYSDLEFKTDLSNENFSKMALWRTYKTLFLNQKEDLYSIFDFQTYPNGQQTNIEVGESYCEKVFPLKELLENKKIDIKEKTLSIPKAVDLFRSYR